VEPIARRRRFSGSEKRRLLAEAERCKARGQLGAFLRREGLYSSMLANWKKQVGKAELAALAPKGERRDILDKAPQLADAGSLAAAS